MEVTLTLRKYKSHRDQEKIIDNSGLRKKASDQGKLLRIVYAVMTHPIWEVAAPNIRFGKPIQFLLILVGTSILIVLAIVSSPWPLVIVTTLLFFVIGWIRAGSSTS